MRSSQIAFAESHTESLYINKMQDCLDNLDSCCMPLLMYNHSDCGGTENCCVYVQGDHSICNILKKYNYWSLGM